MSSTLHDRNRTPSNLAANAAPSTKSSSRNQHHHHHHQANSASSSASQHSARDSFMSYFFGQSGPPTGPHASPASTSSGQTFTEVGGNPVDNMHALRPSNNPAYDMKSLEKHIEAVSYDILAPRTCIFIIPTRFQWKVARILLPHAKKWKRH